MPQTVFFAITIITAGLIVVPLWNYTKFYVALNNFDYTLTSVTIHTSQITVPTSALAKINVTLTATNPTDYSGLHIGTVGCDLQYVGPDHQVWVPTARGKGHYETTYWWLLTQGTAQAPGPLRPNSNMTILIQISIRLDYNKPDYQQNSDFINYLRTSPTEIKWYIGCDLPLNSFLGAFGVARGFSVSSPLNLSAT